MVGDLVSWAEMVGIIGKRPRRDAVSAPRAAASETVGDIEEDGLREFSRIDLLLPVTVLVVSTWLVENGRHHVRLVASIAALISEGIFMGLHKQAMEGKESALCNVKTTPEIVDMLARVHIPHGEWHMLEVDEQPGVRRISFCSPED